MHRGPGRIYAAQRATQLSPDCARRAILGQLVPHVHLSNALLLLCLLPLQRPQATQHAPITTRGRREESSQPCKREKPGTDAAEAQPIDGLAVGLCVCSTYIYMRVYALYTYAYIDVSHTLVLGSWASMCARALVHTASAELVPARCSPTGSRTRPASQRAWAMFREADFRWRIIRSHPPKIQLVWSDVVYGYIVW